MKNVQEFVHYRERDGRKIIYSKYISNVIITMATNRLIGKNKCDRNVFIFITEFHCTELLDMQLLKKYLLFFCIIP